MVRRTRHGAVQSGDSAEDSHLFGRTAWEEIRKMRNKSGSGSNETVSFFYHNNRTALYERDRRDTVKEKTVLETYEKKRELVQEFNLTSDLFAGKTFQNTQERSEHYVRDSG